MIKFHTIGQIEKRYEFTDAVAAADTFNGAFGDISSGTFTVGAGKSKAIMQKENGDDADLDKYPIAKGSHVRVIDLDAFDGENIELYGFPLPDSVAVNDKLDSDATGALKVNSAASTGFYLEVKEIIGNKLGVVALVHKATA